MAFIAHRELEVPGSDLLTDDIDVKCLWNEREFLDILPADYRGATFCFGAACVGVPVLVFPNNSIQVVGASIQSFEQWRAPGALEKRSLPVTKIGNIYPLLADAGNWADRLLQT